MPADCRLFAREQQRICPPYHFDIKRQRGRHGRGRSNNLCDCSELAVDGGPRVRIRLPPAASQANFRVAPRAPMSYREPTLFDDNAPRRTMRERLHCGIPVPANRPAIVPGLRPCRDTWPKQVIAATLLHKELAATPRTWSRRRRTQSGCIGRAPSPDSPPTMIQEIGTFPP
jgi:hypothetical protein